MNDNRKIGLLGEVYASRYLREQGYMIIMANYLTNIGEIDIIAQKRDECVFCEVKTRSGETLFSPEDAVDSKKQERLKSTAATYMLTEKIKCKHRFDVIEVVFDKDDFEVKHIKNAF